MNPDKDHGLKNGDQVDVVLPKSFAGTKQLEVTLAYDSYLGRGLTEFISRGRVFEAATGPVGKFSKQTFSEGIEVATFTVSVREADILRQIVLTRA